MLAIVIFIVTLVLVTWRPRGLGIGWSALGGACVALATGVITLSDIPVVWHIVWNATFTFVALIVISVLLDEAGFFRWAALHVARWGRGNSWRLFPLIILFGAVISAFFANDGAALLLTPIVLAILLQLGFKPSTAFAFAIGTGFVADTTSLPLIISNLVNIVSANYFSISFDHYASIMVPVDLVALASTLLVLCWYFRRHLTQHYRTEEIPNPKTAIKDRAVFYVSFPLLTLLLTSYFVTAHQNIPTSAMTGPAAIILLAVAGRWYGHGKGQVINTMKVLRAAPWQVVLFSLGMYLVVFGLSNAGLTRYVAYAFEWLSRHGIVVATLGTGFISAALSSLMNNMPSVLIGALAIHHSHGIPTLSNKAMIYANVIGCDLGPKFSPIGSLATLLWLHVLDRKGYKITWSEYIKVGLVLTPPVLILTLLSLAMWLKIFY